MESMAAKEMHSWQLKLLTAKRALGGLEYSHLTVQSIDLGPPLLALLLVLIDHLTVFSNALLFQVDGAQEVVPHNSKSGGRAARKCGDHLERGEQLVPLHLVE